MRTWLVKTGAYKARVQAQSAAAAAVAAFKTRPPKEPARLTSCKAKGQPLAYLDTAACLESAGYIVRLP